MLISYACKMLQEGKYRKEDEVHPIAQLIKFRVKATVDGLAAQTSLEVRHAAIFTAEFVPFVPPAASQACRCQICSPLRVSPLKNARYNGKAMKTFENR